MDLSLSARSEREIETLPIDLINNGDTVEHWLKQQINEAHKVLDAMGVPDREARPDAMSVSGKNVFSLGVPERLRWLREHWAPKRTPGIMHQPDDTV